MNACVKVFTWKQESQFVRGFSSVGEGVQVEWPLSVFSKSTDSCRRSPINYYFKLFRFREDKKGGRDAEERVTQSENSVTYNVVDCLLVCIFFPNPRERIFSVSVAVFCHLRCQTFYINRTERAPRLLLLSLHRGAQTDRQTAHAFRLCRL